MTLVIVSFWCVVSLAAIIIFLTIIPIRYDICGVWRDTKLCRIQVQYGPLSGSYRYDSKKLHDFRLSFLGIRFGEKTKTNKGRDGLAISEIWHILGKDLLVAVFRTIKAIYRHSRPRVWNINGVLGFDDPYYTGIFAAARQLLPGISIEPDFSREVYDLNIHICGRIVVLVLIYYVLGFLVSRDARPHLVRLWKSRKIKRRRSEKTAFSS